MAGMAQISAFTRFTIPSLVLHALVCEGRHLACGLPSYRVPVHIQRRSSLIRATSVQEPVGATTPAKDDAGPNQLLQRLREDLRANLAQENKMKSEFVDSSGKATIRTVAIVLTVAAIAYGSAPAMLDILAPLVVSTAGAGTATTAVTGVFMVPLGIVFGTMTSMTANVLRQRQLNVREVFYKEVAALDALSNVLAKLFQREPRRLLSTQAAVFRYCELSRAQVEPGTGMTEEVLCSFFAQRAALGTINGQLASISDREVQTAAFNFSPAQAGSDVGRAWDLVNQILQLQVRPACRLASACRTAC